ncbi:MAG: cobalamin biosynthesis protein CobW, partial [Bacteroidales bacterium]|nr:cobalamin biosynthesis protein CobW [Bacteroidales bacterium]
DYANIDIDNIINTYLFDFEDVVDSAGWIHEFEKEVDEDMEEEAHHPHHHDEEEHHEHHHHDHEDDDDDEEHEHHHHHHHHHHDHEGGEVEEYGISTFVYYRRQPFDLVSFDNFIAKKWNKNIIRAKGLCYFNNEPDISYLFEQSGVQKKITDIGYWFCTASKEDLKEILDNNPDALRDWDDYYGDRMIKIVFIGQHMDIQQLTKELDACLTDLKL